MSLIYSLLLILMAGPAPLPASDGAPLRNCRVVDGDSLRCGRERIRLIGIDAPELPGHCQEGRRCAPGNPFASRASLARAMAGRLTIERVGSDRYGRTLGLVRGPVGDLSCWQLRNAQARYRADWDDGRALARKCREAR